MAEKHTNLDDLEGHECPRCERTHPGPDYDGQPGFCTQPWGTDPDCERIYVAALETRLRASEAECARLRRELEDVRKLDAAVDGRSAWWECDKLQSDWACNVHTNGGRDSAHGKGPTPAAARRAAVEYLEKERKDG